MENKKEGIYYGYIMVIVIFFIITIVEGLMYCFGIFFKPLQSEFGWSSTQVSMAFTLFMIVHGLFYIVTGKINDRFGPRVVVTVCGFFLGLGYFLISRINALWQLYVLYGLILAIGTSGAYVPLISTINRWFVKKRSLMTGICSAGVGVGTMIIPPFTSRLILSFGWRQASAMVGIISLVFLGIVAQLLKRNPDKLHPSNNDIIQPETKILKNTHESFSLRQAVLTPQFWILVTAFFGFGLCLQAVMVHIVPYAISLGNPLTQAAVIIAFIGGASTFGRVVIGAAADKIGNKTVTITSFILMTSAVVILIFSKKIEMFYIFAIVFGFGYGGLVAMSSLLVTDLFGLQNHGLIFGVFAFIITLGGGVGPLVAGYIYDVSSSYYILLLILLAVSTTASVLISLLKPTSISSLPLGHRE